MAGKGYSADKVTVFDPNAPIAVPQLRPFEPGEYVDNGDGSRSTERTVSVPLPDGSWMNAPSLWMSPKGPWDFGMNEDYITDMALWYERATGKKFPRYGSVDEAVQASKARSAGGGVFQGEAAH